MLSQIETLFLSENMAVIKSSFKKKKNYEKKKIGVPLKPHEKASVETGSIDAR